ncbi:MAG: hypothetical protein JRE88_04015 [Deltaproteobacteria bacterium]|nr:hypothetical protein [Deltaproteobacteria bacterium]
MTATINQLGLDCKEVFGGHIGQTYRLMPVGLSRPWHRQILTRSYARIDVPPDSSIF